MSFFLLGQGRDSLDLRLISDQVFKNKQDAMAELASLTADPDFPHWDADVLVMDLDAGTPVLLVKPQAAPAPAVIDADTDTDADADADTDADTEPLAVVIDDAPEVAVEPVVSEELEAEPEDEEAFAEAVDGLADEDIPDALELDDQTAGVWESPQVEASIADDLVAIDDDESEDSLASAIKRATGSLESEGIVAPESIGPVEVADQGDEADVEAEVEGGPEASETAPAAWPWAVQPSDETADVVAGEPAIDELVLEEPVAEEPADEPVLEEPASTEPVLQQPVADVAPYVPDPFEEPAIDVGASGMVSLPVDESAADVGAPVILGEYGAAGIAGDLVIDDQPSAPMSESPDSTLEPVALETDLEHSTCEECVYADTCPNKGELDPKSCGSFQWK